MEVDEAKRRGATSLLQVSTNQTHDSQNLVRAAHHCRVRQRRRLCQCTTTVTAAAVAAPLTLLACGWAAFQSRSTWGAEAFAVCSSSSSSHRQCSQQRTSAAPRWPPQAGVSGWGRRERRPTAYKHRAIGEVVGKQRRSGVIAGATVEDIQEGGRRGGGRRGRRRGNSKSETIDTLWEDDADAINHGVYTAITEEINGAAILQGAAVEVAEAEAEAEAEAAAAEAAAAEAAAAAIGGEMVVNGVKGVEGDIGGLELETGGGFLDGVDVNGASAADVSPPELHIIWTEAGASRGPRVAAGPPTKSQAAEER